MAGNTVSIVVKAKDEASKTLGDVEKKASGLGKAFGEMGKIAGGFVLAKGILQAPAAIGSFIGSASDLNETLSKSNTIFGANAKAIEGWASGAAKDFGLSKQGALEAAGTFGNLFTQIGLGTKPAADMSQSITELAADFASFHNADITSVIDAQTAAFRGEYDALQRFVPTINGATVETRALAMSGKENAASLTEQDKALAVHALMLEGAGEAAGDFDRTSDGLANKQRILGAQFSDMKARIGTELLPVMTAFVGFVSDTGIPALGKLADLAQEKLVPGFRALAEFVGTNLLPPLEQFAEWFSSNESAMQAAGVAIGTVLVVAFAALAVSAGAAAVAVIAASLPIIAITAAVAALGAGIFLLVKHWDDLTAKYPALKDAQDMAVTAFTAVKDVIVNHVVPAIQAATAWFNEHILPALKDIAGFIVSTVIPNLAAFALKVIEIHVTIGEKILAIAGFFLGLRDDVMEYIGPMVTNIGDFSAGVVNLSVTIGQRVGDIIGFFLDLKTRVVGFIQPIIDKIQALIDKITSIPSMPDIKVPSMGGIGGAIGGFVPKFATGGMVPGPIGAPLLAVVHGGEEVRTPAQQRSGSSHGSGGSLAVYVTVMGSVISERELSASVMREIRRGGMGDVIRGAAGAR